MHRTRLIFIACTGAICVAGCANQPSSQTQKAQAAQEWNDARASVLESLAADQYRGGNLDKCQETLDQALRLAPQKPELHLLAAKLAIEQGNLEAAEAQVVLARRLDPRNAEADYLDGIVLQRWQEPQKALDAYAAAVRKAPREISYLLAEAEMLVALDKTAEALSLLQSKAAVFEHSAVIRDEMGQLLLEQKQTAQAVAVLRQASMLAADDSTIREHLAFALYTDRQYVEAAGVFERLLKDPDYANRADLQGAIGQCEAQDHRFTEARTRFEAATRLDGSCSGYWLGLARVTLSLGDLTDAQSAVEKAISLDADSSESQCLLGYIQLKQKRLPQSLTAFRAAATLDATDSVSVCMQGYVLQQMGCTADAHACYARALEADPNDKLAARLLSQIPKN